MENLIDTKKRVITVFSPKGGVGTTSVAANLGISMHKLLDEDVLVVDGKHLFGHLALYCNLRTSNSINDLIEHAGSLDERLIRQVVFQHNSGIYVLPSPNSIVEAQGIQPNDLYTVLQALQDVYPNIIIDGGNYLHENTVTYMDTSGKVLVVLNPDLASLRDTRKFLDLAGSVLAYPKEKMLLVLNFAGRKENIKKDEIEKILSTKIFSEIPYDSNLTLSAINEGVPFILKKPRHAISRSINEISENLVDIYDNPDTET